MARLGRIGAAAGDFTDEADVARVTGAAVEFLGGLDTLVVSSGRSAIGSVLTATRAQFDDILTTNLTGPFLAVQAAAPHLIRAAPASIILIASVVGTVAMKERVAYCASKAGVLGMTRAMALDLAEHRVRVNAISPSLVLTELAQEILSREADPAATLARRRSAASAGPAWSASGYRQRCRVPRRRREQLDDRAKSRDRRRIVDRITKKKRSN